MDNLDKEKREMTSSLNDVGPDMRFCHECMWRHPVGQHDPNNYSVRARSWGPALLGFGPSSPEQPEPVF